MPIRNRKQIRNIRSAQFIELHVAKLLKKHNVSIPPVPVREIAEREGLVVNFEPFTGEGDVSAVLKRHGQKAVVGVNSAHSAKRQRFSIAHELGHYFLHKEESLFVDFAQTLHRPKGARIHFRNKNSSLATNREEIEANSFAAFLLMPHSMLGQSLSTLMDEYPDIAPEVAIQKLAREYNVSIAAMEFRLLNLGYLVKLDE